MTDKIDARISTVIIDDSADVRYLVDAVLGLDGSFDIVGEAEHPMDGLDVVLATDPDLVLVDYHLGSEDGLELVRALRRAEIRATLVVMTGDDVIRMAPVAISSGAHAVIAKQDLSYGFARELHSTMEARALTVA